jgi:GT2 family glycosyltransferase
MRFSIVIPTYNNKILLQKTLEALNHQKGYSREDYEVLVVDDGSNDHTYDWIKDCGRNYVLKYLYLERNTNSCRSRSRNAGWLRAAGEIIVFIDSDIVVKEDYLQELCRCFSVNQDIMVTGPRLMLEQPVGLADIADPQIFDRFHFEKNRYDRLEFRYFLYSTASYNANAILAPWTQVYSCNLAVPRRWLEQVGGFDENFKEWGMEDVELGYSLYKCGVKLVFNSKLEVLHQYHGERNDLMIAADKLAGYEKNVDYFLTKHPQALRMERKIGLKYLTGDLSAGKLVPIDLHPGRREVEIEFKNPDQLTIVMEQLVELTRGQDELKITVFDYVENTDLDIWVQLLDTTKNIVRYFPMSRRIDIAAMARYIESEKIRQHRRRMKEGGS